MEGADTKLLVRKEGDTLSLTLNNPAQGNCLSPDLVEDLIEVLETAQNVRLATLQGNGRHFCTGFDLSDIQDLSDGDLLWRFVRIELLLQKINRSPFPIAAFAQGQVVGAGADMFAACWRRVAACDARFRMPGWNFGLALGTRRLTRLIGMDNAREMLIDTRPVSATEAERFGLATDIADQQMWPDLVKDLAKRARSLPGFASSAMLDLTRQDTDDPDLAAVVRSAGRPGLKQRIVEYRDIAMRSARENRNAS